MNGSKLNVAIEHDRTRQHLQNAFEGLFAKYDRNFESDDEIDIMDLSVVKRGRTLECMGRPLEFGDAYRYKRHKRKKKNKHKLVINNTMQHGKKNKKKTNKKERIDINNSIFETIRNVNQRIVNAIPENPRDFNSVFKNLVKREREQYKEGNRKCDCDLSNCFECTFFTQIF